MLPQLDARPFKALCRSPFKPNVITGLFQLWLTQHYANANNIQQASLKARVWNSDPELSQIQILPLFDYRPNETEQRPALIIKRQELKFIRYGIDNRWMGSGGKDGGTRIYEALMQGSHTVFCIAGESGEAEDLAYETYQELMKFAPVVREWVNLTRIQLVGVGEVSKLEEATENFIVPIDIAYSFPEKWELLTLDAPILTEIRLLLTS